MTFKAEIKTGDNSIGKGNIGVEKKADFEKFYIICKLANFDTNTCKWKKKK